MWRERRFHAYEAFSRSERNPDARGHLSVPVDNILHATAGDPVFGEEPGDHDKEGELDALAPQYSSADRRFRKWEDVVLDSFACTLAGSADSPLCDCRDHSTTTAAR